ncbi:magnesium transporter CorA family protein [Paenibacillus sepulcri]|uniref:Magnesium transporter CorA family protein n=1 Tax=Paenibacillus sepulcri TaxID=359917 RepID=A0ABS7C309_9BACL|nr:magnesium transporter CorA family protein [Paenibacillus sepulcri]
MMMHRMLQFPANWEWHVLHKQRPDGAAGLGRRGSKSPSHHRTNSEPHADGSSSISIENSFFSNQNSNAQEDEQILREFKQAHPEMGNWVNETLQRSDHNHVMVSELEDGRPILCGTLMFQITEDYEDIKPFHFWMTNQKLVTLHSDYRLAIRMQLEPWSEKLERCQSAPEAFFVMLTYIGEILHRGLDTFETRLGELEQTMRHNNRTGLMNSIFERRFDLLHWSHLFIPIEEIYGAAKEAFLDEVMEKEEFKRFEFKVLRIRQLLEHYAVEIDTLLMMDDSISTFRGNDIMKTLTIFTTLFAPATVIGAIWGMNFDIIPYAHNTWGFIGASLLIAIMTLLVYWWLWHKGWTGDLLYARKPKQIIKSSGGTLTETRSGSQGGTETLRRSSTPSRSSHRTKN